MFFYHVNAIVLTIIVFICHVIPGKDIDIFGWDLLLSIDKIFHFFVFGILSISYLLSFRSFFKNYKNIANNRYIFFVLFIIIIYGFLLELIQGLLIVDRVFEFTDLLSDLLGAVIFMFCFIKLNLNKYFNFVVYG